jgi:hypothetical protein
LSIRNAVIVALVAGIVVQTAARTFAQVNFGKASFDAAFDHIFDPLAVLPVALIAITCMRASLRGGWRSVRFVLAATLLPLGFPTYEGERGSLSAAAEHRWTASGLAAGLTALATAFVVALAGGFAVWVWERRYPRR